MTITDDDYVSPQEAIARRKRFHARIEQLAEARRTAPIPATPPPCELKPPESDEHTRPKWFFVLPPKGTPRIVDIQRAVVRCHPDVTMMDLISQRRPANICRARMIAMYLAKTMTPRSLPEIGRQFGNRDHTTVLHSVRKITREVVTDGDLAAKIDEIKALFVGYSQGNDHESPAED